MTRFCVRQISALRNTPTVQYGSKSDCQSQCICNTLSGRHEAWDTEAATVAASDPIPSMIIQKYKVEFVKVQSFEESSWLDIARAYDAVAHSPR